LQTLSETGHGATQPVASSLAVADTTFGVLQKSGTVLKKKPTLLRERAGRNQQ